MEGEQTLNEPKKGKWVKFVIAVIIVLAGVIVAAAWHYFSNEGVSEDESSDHYNKCENIDTSDWLTYDNTYTIKYPSNWIYEELQGGAGGTQWFIKFGPDKENLIVYVGGSARDIEGLKEDLEAGNILQITSKYKVLDETLVNVYSPSDTRLTLQGPESYKSYLFYLVYGEIPPIIMGPSDASSDQFDRCEPEIFLKMVDSYTVTEFPGQSDEVETETTYTDEDSSFSFNIPALWQMTERYYYSTAAGETSDVPTILFRPTGGIDAQKNFLNINLRQNFCPDSDSRNSEPINGDSDIVINFYYLDGNQTCAEVDLSGVDKNGQPATHHFLMMYDDFIEGKEIFKDIIRSYKAN